MPAEDKVILSEGHILIAINLRLQSEKAIRFNQEILKLENTFVFSASNMFCLEQIKEVTSERILPNEEHDKNKTVSWYNPPPEKIVITKK